MSAYEAIYHRVEKRTKSNTRIKVVLWLEQIYCLNFDKHKNNDKNKNYGCGASKLSGVG